MKDNEYQRQNIPDPESWNRLPRQHVSTQEVRHNPRWDKRMKHIIKLKRRGLL